MAFEYNVQRVSLCLKVQAYIIWLLRSKNARDYGLEFACVYVVRVTEKGVVQYRINEREKRRQSQS